MYNELLTNQNQERLFEPITFDGREPDSLQNLPFYQQVNLARYDECVMMENYVPVIEKADTIRLTSNLTIDVYGDINEPWFLGQDVARIMDYKQPKQGVYDVNSLVNKLSEFDCSLFILHESGTHTNGTTSKHTRNKKE